MYMSVLARHTPVANASHKKNQITQSGFTLWEDPHLFQIPLPRPDNDHAMIIYDVLHLIGKKFFTMSSGDERVCSV
jgi:hypothetical protein